MARRSVKKVPSKQRSAAPQVAVTPLSANPSGDGSGSGSFKKFFVLILIILGVLYGPSLFKNGVRAKPNEFPLTKVAQFSLNPSPGKTFFVTSVAAIGPNLLAVTDSPGCQILEYDFKGNLIRKWGGKSGKAPNEFNEPSGITTDRKGNLYVLDTWNGAIKVFDVKGKLEKILDLTHFGFFYGPRCVGWGGDSLLIPNGGNFHLVRLSFAGDLLSQWAGKDEIGNVGGAVGDGKNHYYACGLINDKARIQEFDQSGQVLRSIKTEGNPSCLALDSKERLYVECGNDSRVFDSSGNLLGVLTDEAEPGKPIYFNGIDITSDDMILTSGGDNVTIYKIPEKK